MKIKRILAFTLSMTMIVSMVPALVLAEEPESKPEETTVAETSEEKEKETSKPSEKEPAKPEEKTEAGKELPKESEPSETEAAETEPSETENKEPAESEEQKPSDTEESVPKETEPEVSGNGPEESAKKKAANSIIANGTCGEGLSWSFDDAGVLTITGSGTMDDWDVEDDESDTENDTTPWSSYKEQISIVKISGSVKNIGSYAFYNCTNLTSKLSPIV